MFGIDCRKTFDIRRVTVDTKYHSIRSNSTHLSTIWNDFPKTPPIFGRSINSDLNDWSMSFQIEFSEHETILNAKFTILGPSVKHLLFLVPIIDVCKILRF